MAIISLGSIGSAALLLSAVFRHRISARGLLLVGGYALLWIGGFILLALESMDAFP
jgi:hypothetical protein